MMIVLLKKKLNLNQEFKIDFDYDKDLVFHYDEFYQNMLME